MMRELKASILDMLESIRIIEGYVKGATEKDFESDIQMRDSVMRRLEIIGEASKAVPERLKSKFKEIPWKDIVGTRDVLIHTYYGVINERIWKAVKDDLPKLKDALLEMQKEKE